VNLYEAEDRYPAQLSGRHAGCEHRWPRALVTKPRLLLLDEPFAALDEITRFRLTFNCLLMADARITWVFVTHSISDSRILRTAP